MLWRGWGKIVEVSDMSEEPRCVVCGNAVGYLTSGSHRGEPRKTCSPKGSRCYTEFQRRNKLLLKAGKMNREDERALVRAGNPKSSQSSLRQGYRATLYSIAGELRKGLASKGESASRVQTFWAATRALARLEGEYFDDLEPLPREQCPLRNAMRAALFLLDKPSSPVEIREVLVQLGYDLRRYTFPMAAIHKSLAADVKAGIVVLVSRQRGARTFKLAKFV